jgi:hypothetical protein
VTKRRNPFPCDRAEILARHRNLLAAMALQHAWALGWPIAVLSFTAVSIWWLGIAFDQIGSGLAQLAKLARCSDVSSLDGRASSSAPPRDGRDRSEDCAQMPGKMANSAPQPPFELPKVPVAVRTSRLSCRKPGKARIFTPDRQSSGESRFTTPTRCTRGVIHAGGTGMAGHGRTELKLFILLSISLLSLFKGFRTDLMGWGEPYWLISYHDGLIRRGLLGQLFSFLYDRNDPSRIRSAALSLNLAMTILLVVGLWTWLRLLLERGADGLSPALFVVFATSQFLPTLAFDAGFLDVYLYCLILIGVWAILSGMYGAAGIVGFIGPFVHESFLFLWVTPIFLVFWERLTLGKSIPLRLIAILAIPLVTTIVIYFVPSEQACVSQMTSAPISDAVKEAMIEWVCSQNMMPRLRLMSWNYIHGFPDYLWLIAVLMLPTALIVWATATVRTSFCDRLTLMVGSLAPGAMIIIATDLSRFLAATAMSALLVVFYMQTVRPVQVTRRAVITVCWVVGAIGLFTPLVYSYGAPFVVDSGIIPFTRMPLGLFQFLLK